VRLVGREENSASYTSPFVSDYAAQLTHELLDAPQSAPFFLIGLSSTTLRLRRYPYWHTFAVKFSIVPNTVFRSAHALVAAFIRLEKTRPG